MNKELESVIDRLDASFFYYDLDSLVSHLESLSSCLDDDIKLWYACKANPMSAILKVLRNLNFGIDFASLGELHQILNTGIKGNELIATGPAKSKKYLNHIVKAGVKTIVLESVNQLKWLDEVCAEQGRKVDALLRIQLEWSEGKSCLGGDSITPFGLDSVHWEEVNISEYQNVNVVGFHIFQWGNILNLERLESIWDESVKSSVELAQKLNIDIEVIDLGGGLGISYDGSQEELNFKEVYTLLKSIKEKYQVKKIWMELGRYAVANCGKYFTKIVDIKTVRGQKMLVTEGGINHIARPALTKEAFPCSALKQSSEISSYQVHGPLCTALDHLGTFELPDNLEVGDWLVFDKVGAYGFTESMPYFLCHELPGEVIKYRGDMMIPRPPKTSYEWMI
jgi:diaminopimelate decarboxylase